MSETKCGTGCITPSVCHPFFCNRVVQDVVLPSPTPTPPEQGELREALMATLAAADTVIPYSATLARLLGLPISTWTPEQVAESLLARVAPQGETCCEDGWPCGDCEARVRARMAAEHAVPAIGFSGEVVWPTPPAAETRKGRTFSDAHLRAMSELEFTHEVGVGMPAGAVPVGPAAETGEPVAWVPMDSEGDKWWQNTRESEKQAKASLTRQKDYDGFEFVMVPLYAEAMVERVARHLFECDNLPLPADLQWDDATEQHQESYRRSARAILAAANMPAAGTGTAVEARDAFYRSYRAIVQGVAEHQNAVGDVSDLSHELNAVVAAERRDERALCVSLVQGARKSVSTDSATLFNAGVDAARAALSAETGTTE